MSAEIRRVEKSEQEWRGLLPPEVFRITRKKGTERAFSGKYWNEKMAGAYCCVCCRTPLFSSEHKFDSGTGWPSYWQAISKSVINYHEDRGLMMVRTRCAAQRAMLTWGMCFPMARHLQASVTASTPPRSLLVGLALNASSA